MRCRARVVASPSIAFVGSIKWRERAPFDGSDIAQLAQKGALVPGAGPATPLVAISRTGVDPSVRGLSLALTPDELLGGN